MNNIIKHKKMPMKFSLWIEKNTRIMIDNIICLKMLKFYKHIYLINILRYIYFGK